MMNLASLSIEYRRLRDELLLEYPELVDDGETLADTLEGINDLPDVLAKIVRNARRDEAMADGLAELIKQEQDRKARLQNRAEKRRRIVLHLMQAVEMGKIEQPDFTASVRRVPPAVVVTDETRLPDRYLRVVKSPDKAALREALAQGEEVPGAALGNGGETLSIRTR